MRKSAVLALVSLFLLFACKDSPPSPGGGVVLPPDSITCPSYDTLDYCGNVCRGYPAIPDLGSGSWMGMQGGLYPGGQNTRPGSHNDAGIEIAEQIKPLDVNGQPDSTNGKIVFLTVGMSNASQEFAKLRPMLDAVPGKNPYLVFVNGAQGGWDINKIVNPDTAYWRTIDTMLLNDGLSALQVQVIWFKEAELGPTVYAPDTTFLGYTEYLKQKFITVMNIVADKFPNAGLCYAASRIYGGYGEIDMGNPEPFAYYQGWTVKWMIEDQINGDPVLRYQEPGRMSPWLSWGTYLWADGLNARSDGLRYICPDDFQPDGRHPSDPVGRLKVAGLLYDFFVSDETARIWLFGPQTASATSGSRTAHR